MPIQIPRAGVKDMEMKMLISKFAEWLHEAFVPANQDGVWIRRDHSETLDSSQLQEKFLQERPEFRSLWEKAGLLALLIFALSTGIVMPLSATNTPVKVQQDSVKRDTIIPVGFKLIRVKEYPIKSNQKSNPNE